jgi:amidohydrolase
MLLAAAKHFSRHRNFDGTVYLIFQPAEEGGGGAREMIKDGIFKLFPMEAVFGAHNWPGMPVGMVGVNPGAMMASSNAFRVVIKGKGSHAALAYMGIDPVPVACQMVMAWQTIITRNRKPLDPGVISATMIHTGEAINVVPDSAEIRGTVRTFTIETLDLIERRMKEVAEGTCAAFGATCEFEFTRTYPPTVNHAAETEFVRKTLGQVVGEANVVPFEPTMGAEDFSFFLQEKPGCYFVLGNGDGAHRIGGHGLGPCMLHNPSYDFNDELIPVGASCWVKLAETWLAPR